MNIKHVSIEFIITFVVLYAIYYFFIIRKCKKNKDYVPVEVNYILLLYKINYKKINLLSMIKVVSIITCFVLAFSITMISNTFNSIIINIIFASSASILLAIILYGIVGKVYQRKSYRK